MAKYKIESTSGSASTPWHYEPSGNVNTITALDLNGAYAEFGGLVDISTFVKGWSASTFVDLRKASQTSAITDAITYLSGVTTVENGNITNTKPLAMFMQSPNLKKFDATLTKAVDASFMFINCTALTSFSVSMPMITTGNQMFSACQSLTSFTSNLDKLYKADGMFGDCPNLKSWTVALPNLWNGTRMFSMSGTIDKVPAYAGKVGPRTWGVALPELVNASSMFFGCALQSWTTNMPKVTHTGRMFDTCTSLVSFEANLPSCTYAWAMFYKCSGLKTFKAYMPVMTQDPDATSESGDNKGFLSMFALCTAIESVEITTNADVADYVSESNMALRSTATWTRTVEDVEGGLKKITLTAVNK